MKHLSQPFFLFATTAVLILLFGFLNSQSTLNVNKHDTYFVIASFHVALFLCGIFLLLAIIYYAFLRCKIPLYKGLGITHFLMSIIPVLVIQYIVRAPMAHRVYQHMSDEMSNLGKVNAMISISVLFGIIGQLLFLINIIVTLLRKNNTEPIQ